MSHTRKVRLEQILLEQNLITQQQLDAATIEQMASGKKLNTVLVEMEFIQENTLFQLLSDQLNIPYIDLRNFSFNPEFVHLIPESFARHFHCLVLTKDDKGILIGMADPQDVSACDEIALYLKQPIHIALVREADLQKILDVVYCHSDEISNFAEKLAIKIADSEYDLSQLASGLSAVDTPAAQLLQILFEDAVQMNASDIHIEPGDKTVCIRYRVDGLLHKQILKDAPVAEALALRLKLMAHLNIAEKHIPQEGRFSIKIKNKNFDVRLSTLPTLLGESVVMHLLNQSTDLIGLDHIGMPDTILLKLRKIMASSNGLLLVTGMTGSGKTKTLYSILSELNTQDKKIISVEDPIEYRLPHIIQVQIQPKIDLTFARALRASLHHDPDMMMVSELRDYETTEIAIRAAMTGRFVLSALHANDTVASVIRLLDMGIKGYLLASTLRAIISQRLVRCICTHCCVDYNMTPQEEVWLTTVTDYSNVIFKKGAGCVHCHQTGFKGQVALFELLEINTTLANALRLNHTQEFMRIIKEEMYFTPLILSGLELARSGITTISEVMRVTGDDVSSVLCNA